MIKKKGIWWVRMVVPQELYDFLPHPHTGKKNLLESLCTKDRGEATNKAPAVIAKFQAVIAEARRLIAQANSPLGRVLAAHPDLRRVEEIADLVAEEGGEAFPEVRNLPRLAWEDIQRIAQQPSTGDAVLFDATVEAWGNEKKQSEHTKNGYLNKTARFVKWLAADRQKRGISALPENMPTVTKAEWVRYKNDMLTPGHEIAAGLGETSIIQYLVDLRTIFIYASHNNDFANPTDGVTLPRRTRQMIEKNKWRSYTLTERKQILSAARSAGEVIRWCQRLAWATGSRMSEIAEASVKDVFRMGRGDNAFSVMRIMLDDRSEDASLKTMDSWRIVALHAKLIEEGFLDYWRRIKREYGDDAPLFPQITPDKYGRRGNPASRRVSKWMRNDLKITDKKVAPNHSWRHTFGSVHTNELSPPTEERILKHIMGHSQGGNMTAHYSEVKVRASRVDIERMPCPLDLPDEDEDELFDEMAAQ